MIAAIQKVRGSGNVLLNDEDDNDNDDDNENNANDEDNDDYDNNDDIMFSGS